MRVERLLAGSLVPQFMQKEKILITGALGQIGSALTHALRAEYGDDQVLVSDVKPLGAEHGLSRHLDVTDASEIKSVISEIQPTQIFHLASLLSATSEAKPDLAWKVNLEGLRHMLEACREQDIQLFWPSSIAVFGPSSPKVNTPQQTILEPNTLYGIGKLFGERLCAYYYEKHGLDVRSIRYPGLISYEALPGGGTTDYAVEIFYKALEQGSYSCFLEADTNLPMMYMPDAVRGTMEIMQADPDQIKDRGSYNFAAFSFDPQSISEQISRHLPQFEMNYDIDPVRQQIAESWPQSIDDSRAREDWNWKAQYDLEQTVSGMLENLSAKLKKAQGAAS